MTDTTTNPTYFNLYACDYDYDYSDRIAQHVEIKQLDASILNDSTKVLKLELDDKELFFDSIQEAFDFFKNKAEEYIKDNPPRNNDDNWFIETGEKGYKSLQKKDFDDYCEIGRARERSNTLDTYEEYVEKDYDQQSNWYLTFNVVKDNLRSSFDYNRGDTISAKLTLTDRKEVTKMNNISLSLTDEQYALFQAIRGIDEPKMSDSKYLRELLMMGLAWADEYTNEPDRTFNKLTNELYDLLKD